MPVDPIAGFCNDPASKKYPRYIIVGETDNCYVGAEGATAPESLRQKDRDYLEALESGRSTLLLPPKM